nr:immunoglobulin light chain junction region [Macaca mulatta]
DYFCQIWDISNHGVF